MLGNIDIIVCGNSDPGTSTNVISICKDTRITFRASTEPSDFYYKISKEMHEKYKQKGEISING